MDQLQIAPTVVNTLSTGMVLLVVGSGVVAIGGGGIETMQQYWDRAARRLEEESDPIQLETKGLQEAIRRRFEERKEQAQQVQAGQP